MYVVKKGVVYHSGKVLMQGACFCEEALYKPGLHVRTPPPPPALPILPSS